MKTQTLLNKIPACLLILVMLLANSAFADSPALLAHYSKIFSSGAPLAQVDAAKELEWKGLSDPALFDIIEKNLLANYKTADKITADYAAWMAKALAFSGQAKYLPTLQEAAANAGNKGTVKHATNAIEVLPQYTQWNAIISSTANANTEKSVELNGYANMLRSGNRELQRIACKRIEYENIKDKWLLDILNAEALKAITAASTGSEDVDAVNWMLRSLASSGMAEYRSTLQNAETNAVEPKVRKNAAGYLKKYPQ